MKSGRMLKGTHIEEFGPYFLQISNCRICELLCQYLTVISKIFIREFSSKFILWSSIILSAEENHIYKECVTSQTQSNMAFRCRFYFPMPQLTADCDRVIVIGVSPSDGTEFNTIYGIRFFQMMMEIRISEDYCLSDIYVADFGNITLRHITKMTPSLVKKFELCVFVSSTYAFCAYKDNIG
jgi:hypothetical protein